MHFYVRCYIGKRTNNMRFRSGSFTFTCILAAIMVIFVIGCSGGGNPTAPDTGPGLSTPSEARDLSNSRMLWGFFSVEIDPVSMEVMVEPLRSAMFNANVTKFLQPPSSPIHMMSVAFDLANSDIPNDLLAVDVSVRHPFIGVNKFRGFDVRGIFMADGSISSDFDPGLVIPDWPDSSPTDPSYDPVVLNPDGYTRWWNPTEFTDYGVIFGYTEGAFSTPSFYAGANLNPFKYFADELDLDTPFILDPANRGSFSLEPGVNQRKYIIQFDEKPWKFNYAIDASWAEPDPAGEPDYPVDSFPVQANAQEAYKIDLMDNDSTVYFFNEDSYGGEFELGIEIYDWQAVGASLTPSVILDEINAVWIESPAFDPGYFDILAGTYDITPGAGDTSAVFNITVNPSFDDYGIDHAGRYPVLIGVESSNPDSYMPQIGPPGENFEYPDAPLTAYATAWVDVSGVSPQEAPVVLSVVPDEGIVSTVISDLEIHGEYFMDGATVEFSHTDMIYDIGPITTGYIDSTLLTIDLDLNDAELGFYDVTVTNPDMQNGTLEEGFEVVDQIPVLVLEEEYIFPPYNSGTRAYTPAITEEVDNDICFCFEEYKPEGNLSYGSAWRSYDDGLTWPDAETGIWSFGGVFAHWDSLKVWPTTYGNTIHTTQLWNWQDGYWATGFIVEAFTDQWPWPQGCHITQRISHFTELLMDKDMYVYAIGDEDGIIKFKRSEVPEEIQGGPSGGIWSSFPTYTITNNGYLSRARSSALYDDTMWLAYFEPDGNVIRLAHELDTWQTWDTTTIIWDGAGSNTFDARDPGLHIDGTGFHVTFIRFSELSGMYELCYTYSADATLWSDPVVIRESLDEINDSPIDGYYWEDTYTLGTTWWEGDMIYAAFSLDGGASWSDAVLVSEDSPENSESDFVISESGYWHIVYSSLSGVSGLTEIRYRRGHMEMQ